MDATRNKRDENFPEKETLSKNLGKNLGKNYNFNLVTERYDDIRAFQMKEIQEEEFYINNIKRQRERV